MMVVEKKQPLEKNRNLLGQKQRKVSKSNKQICSPAYGNGPPLFPTGLNKSFSHQHCAIISLQNWILLRTQSYPGFRISRSTHSPQFPIHQSPCNIHRRRYQPNPRLQSHTIKPHRPAEKHLCSIQETNKKLDTGRLHWISMEAKHLQPPNLRSRERRRLVRPQVEMWMVTVSPWRAWSTFPCPLSKLTSGQD